MPDSKLLPFLLFYSTLYLSVIIHEFGHVVAGVRNGYRIDGVGFGLGRPRFKLLLGSTLLYIGSADKYMGLTLASSPASTRQEYAAFLRGGIIANAVALALFSQLLWVPSLRYIAWMLTATNLFIGLVSAFSKDINADGKKLRLLKKGFDSSSLPLPQLSANSLMLELAEQFPRISIQALTLINNAHLFVRLRRFAEAEEVLERVLAFPLDDLPAVGVTLQLAYVDLYRETGREEEMWRALEAGERLAQAANSQTLQLTLKVERIQIYALSGRIPEAQKLHDEVISSPARHATINIEGRLIVNRLLIAAGSQDFVAAEQALAEYRAMRQLVNPVQINRLVFQHLALCYHKAGRQEEAYNFATDVAIASGLLIRGCTEETHWEQYVAYETISLSALEPVTRSGPGPNVMEDIPALFQAFLDEKASTRRKNEASNARKQYWNRVAYGVAFVLMSVGALAGFPYSNAPQNSLHERFVAVAGVLSMVMLALNLVLILIWRFVLKEVRIGGWIALFMAITALVAGWMLRSY